MSFCCEKFKNHSRWLLRQMRGYGGVPLPSFCPWCGKGVTSPAPDPGTSTLGVHEPIVRRAHLAAKGQFAPGKPECPTCKGRGYILRRFGCCTLKPVACGCAAPPELKTEVRHYRPDGTSRPIEGGQA